MFFIIFITGCKSQKNSFAYTSETLKLIPLSKKAFQHITYLETDDYGKVACNGLVYLHGNEAIVFDTPTTNEVSNELIKWITETKKSTIKAVVINHFHKDCLGGLSSFHEHNIPSYASNKTIALSKEKKQTLPSYGFDHQMILSLGDHKIINQYFGEAHTSDNIVSYIPNEELLFGGCMLKSLYATKGYTGDANLNEWSNTIENIQRAYPNLKLAIPGHGNFGNSELLAYTIELFK